MAWVSRGGGCLRSVVGARAIALGDPGWLRFTPKQAQRYWDSH
ncbi:MAG: hypothetical protein SW833_08725 [Cyanobacteriota bacterium]|nr:hypothetical protein [Cyanobacteriota bacterium]